MQQEIIQTQHSEGVSLGGFSLGTGYSWYVELVITLIVMSIIYCVKKYIDHYFAKQRALKTIERYSKKREDLKRKEKIENDIWRNSK